MCGCSAARATGCATTCPSIGCKRECARHYRGQKQIWFLLRMTGPRLRRLLRASGHPEFDAWRWHDYWVPLETVIDFKREVYRQALIELHRFRALRIGARAPSRGACTRSSGRAVHRRCSIGGNR